MESLKGTLTKALPLTTYLKNYYLIIGGGKK